MWIFSGRRLLDLFPCSALLGSTVDTCFFQFTEALYSDPATDSRPALSCFRIQRNAWSSVVHVCVILRIGRILGFST